MREDNNIAIILMLAVVTAIIAFNNLKISNNKDEHIKILEQSLNEQIQEKQVYMNMLEQREES